MATPSPVTVNTDLVTYEILSNGSAIDDTYQVESIVVQHDVNRIPMARLTLMDGSPSKSALPISDSSTFVPGAEIEIKVGYESKDETIFKGVVVQQGLKLGAGGSVLQVECQDKAVKMAVGRKNVSYNKTKDSDIISRIIRESGLTSDVQSTAVELKEVVQYYATNWDFVLSRAEINGMIVTVDDGKVSVKRPDTSSSPVLELTYGVDILEFDGEMDARTQLLDVKSKAWDYTTQQVIDAEGGDQNITSPGNISSSTLAEVLGVSDFDLQSTGPIEQNELQVWADAKMLKSQLSKIRGNVKFQGSALASPGKMIELAGLGDRFNGNAFVSAVTHNISNGNWVTEVELGLNYEWYQEEFDINSPPASGLLPAISGLQNGVVRQIDQDPDGQYRVLVNVPIISNEGEGIWARLSNLYATNTAGTFFYPEIGDEVILGFLNEDPRFPVILGSLYSSEKKAPPFTPDEDNSIKGIVSKSQMKMTFDDKNKVLQLETPSGNMMTISDQDQGITMKDQNGNSIKMNSSGIELISCADLGLRAPGQIRITSEAGTIISSNANVTVSGEGGVSVSGLDVSLSGEAALSLNGGAEASLSGGGVVSIQGAMITIN